MRRLLMLGMASLVACGTEPTSPPPPFAGKIVFQSDRNSSDGAQVLYAMNPDGSDVQLISIPLPPAYGQADISPDGERLAFSRDGIYTMGGAGTGLEHLVPSDGVKPAWSPDGGQIVYSANELGTNDIWVMDQFGNQRTNLTNTPEFTEFAANWSPDGTMLVYERRSTVGGTPYQLWTIGRDGTEARQVTADSENDAFNPAFSPDGSWIVYAWGPGYTTDLRLVRPDGTGDHSIFHTLDGSTVDEPSWAPDGRSIVFTYGFEIATIHTDGTNLQVLTESAINSDPDWGPAPPL
jgi:TolB protein